VYICEILACILTNYSPNKNFCVHLTNFRVHLRFSRSSETFSRTFEVNYSLEKFLHIQYLRKFVPMVIRNVVFALSRDVFVTYLLQSNREKLT